MSNIPNTFYRPEMVTISVPEDCIPAGGKLVEAYETEHEIIVCGDPPDEPEGKPEEDWHNCDAMGCGTLSHVIYRFTKPSP
jgi:hypothetical protein